VNARSVRDEFVMHGFLLADPAANTDK